MAGKQKKISPVPVLIEEESLVLNKTEESQSKLNKQHSYIIFVVVLLVGIGALGFYFAWRAHELKKDLVAAQSQLKNVSSSSSVLSDEVGQLVEQVGKLVVLPTQEQPTVATVTDLDKLKGQAFFANAQIGDKVLIYTNAKKAILYRPSENKIIELAPLNSTAGQQENLPLTLEIRNGSGKNGEGSNVKSELAGNEQVNVIKVGNAQKTYTKTLLYVLKAKSSLPVITHLQQLTGAEIITALPAGEIESTADAVLILGKE